VQERSRCNSLCVAIVVTIVAEPDRCPMRSLGYDLTKMLVESGGCLKEQYRKNFLSARLKKGGVMWLLLWPPSNHFHARAIF